MLLQMALFHSFFMANIVYWGFPVAQMVKNLPAMQETQVQSLGWEDPLEKGMTIHSSILPGEVHGQRRLTGYSPQGCQESAQLSN